MLGVSYSFSDQHWCIIVAWFSSSFILNSSYLKNNYIWSILHSDSFEFVIYNHNICVHIYWQINSWRIYRYIMQMHVDIQSIIFCFAMLINSNNYVSLPFSLAMLGSRSQWTLTTQHTWIICLHWSFLILFLCEEGKCQLRFSKAGFNASRHAISW